MARDGTKSGGAKAGNINASLHKIYLKQLLNKDEAKLYSKLFAEFVAMYGLDSKPADQLLLSTALIDYVRAMRGYLFEFNNPDANVSDALERAVRSMRNNLAEMGVTGKNKVVDNATVSFSTLLAQLAGNSAP